MFRLKCVTICWKYWGRLYTVFVLFSSLLIFPPVTGSCNPFAPAWQAEQFPHKLVKSLWWIRVLWTHVAGESVCTGHEGFKTAISTELKQFPTWRGGAAGGGSSPAPMPCHNVGSGQPLTYVWFINKFKIHSRCMYNILDTKVQLDWNRKQNLHF